MDKVEINSYSYLLNCTMFDVEILYGYTLQATWPDNWRGHECRLYTSVNEHPDGVIGLC